MEEITNALPTIVIGAVLLIIVVLIVRSKIREHKQGGCNCGCPGCNGSCGHSSVLSVDKKETKDET